jgi:hypothetical protein
MRSLSTGIVTVMSPAPSKVSVTSTSSPCSDARVRPMSITCMPPRSSRIASPAAMAKPSSMWTMRITSPSTMCVCKFDTLRGVRGRRRSAGRRVSPALAISMKAAPERAMGPAARA